MVLAALIGGLVLLAAFVWWEHRTPSPMLPLNLFASSQFTATNVVTFVVYGGIGGALFLLPIQLQQVSGYTALAVRASRCCRSPRSRWRCPSGPVRWPPGSAPGCRCRSGRCWSASGWACSP